MAIDLRALAGPVSVGLAADRTTLVERIHLLDRGYERTNRVTQTGAPA